MERLTLKDCKRIWMTTDENGTEVPISDDDLANNTTKYAKSQNGNPLYEHHLHKTNC